MSTKNWQVLVIEDDPDGQDVVQRILRHHDVQFDAAYTGEEALEFLAQHEYTAVVCDLALPGIDGWGLIDRIRNDPATVELPCFAITAYHSAEVAVKAIQCGYTAYFPKPLDPTSFVREMERAIEE